MKMTLRLSSFTCVLLSLGILSCCAYAQQATQQTNQQQLNQQQLYQQRETQKQALKKIQEMSNNLNGLMQQEWGKLNTNTPAPAIAPMIINPIQQLLQPNKSIAPNPASPQTNPSPSTQTPAASQAPTPVNNQLKN